MIKESSCIENNSLAQHKKYQSYILTFNFFLNLDITDLLLI